MALVIEDADVADELRRLAARAGTTPVNIVRRLLREMGGQVDAVHPSAERSLPTFRPENKTADRMVRRREALDRFIAELPPVTHEERSAVRRAQEEMYDENGLPR